MEHQQNCADAVQLSTFHFVEEDVLLTALHLFTVKWSLYMQEALILLWVFNFGAVMAWTPWLYRWHMQPKQVKSD